jgi:hypothetical protein
VLKESTDSVEGALLRKPQLKLEPPISQEIKSSRHGKPSIR